MTNCSFRRAVFDLYTKEQVHLLPDYPKQSGADLLIAFYVQKPTDVISFVTVVPAKTVVEIINRNITELQALFKGKKIGHVKPLFDSTPDETPKDDNQLLALWIGIGVACLLLILVIVLLACLIRYVS